MFYTYILQSKKSGKLYIGYMSDLRKRFKEHKDGKDPYTKGRRPFRLFIMKHVLTKMMLGRENYI